MVGSFTQSKDIDYNDDLSHVLKHRSIKMLLAMVIELSLELEQMNVKTAFLYGSNQKDLRYKARNIML